MVPDVCDFDGDEVCTINDLDELLYVGLGTTESKYDLDGSGGPINLNDRDAFLALTNSFPGDFDLDGSVVSADLNTLAVNWQSTGITSYADGDTNGDGVADAKDLNDVALNWQRGTAAASSVPEPTAMVLILSGIVAACVTKRRKNIPGVRPRAAPQFPRRVQRVERVTENLRVPELAFDARRRVVRLLIRCDDKPATRMS